MTSKIVTIIKPDGSVQKITKNGGKKKQKFVFQYRDYGIYLVTPIIVGLVIGIYIDNFLGTKPIATISLLILGTIGTFYQLIKIVNDERSPGDTSAS